MISVIKEKITDGLKKLVRLNGLETDTKPTDVENGSTFYAMDSDTTYMFNAADGEWVAQPKEEGGGGGGITPSGTKFITSNGNYSVYSYATASVNVPGIVPSGTREFTENGTYDVTSIASAVVNVEGGITPSGSETFTENGTYDVTSLAEAIINVSGSNVEVLSGTATITSDSQWLRIPYDDIAPFVGLAERDEETPAQLASTTFAMKSVVTTGTILSYITPFCVYLRTTSSQSPAWTGLNAGQMYLEDGYLVFKADSSARPWRADVSYKYIVGVLRG